MTNKLISGSLFGFIIPLMLMFTARSARAASGPFGIGHRSPHDHSGIGVRHNQLVLEGGAILTELRAAPCLGGDRQRRINKLIMA